MFGLVEWAIIILLALLVFGAMRAPAPRRHPVRGIEDMRSFEPLAPKSRVSIEFDLAIAAGLVLAAIACVFVLVLSQSGWV